MHMQADKNIQLYDFTHIHVHTMICSSSFSTHKSNMLVQFRDMSVHGTSTQSTPRPSIGSYQCGMVYLVGAVQYGTRNHILYILIYICMHAWLFMYYICISVQKYTNTILLRSVVSVPDPIPVRSYYSLGTRFSTIQNGVPSYSMV